ncbi:MAG: EAL domain-containing protein, partial [Gammaproteobacteria bacterium]
LRAASSGFRELVIRLRHGVTNNYDAANYLERNIAEHEMHLVRIVKDIPALQGHLDSYLQSGKSRDNNWEHFKQQNAVVRNSLRYFQTGFPQFIEIAQSLRLPDKVDASLSSLNTSVLLFALGEGGDRRDELLSMLKTIRSYLVGSNDKLQAEYDLLERHVNIIIQYVPMLTSSMSALMEGDERTKLNMLEQANNAMLVAENRQASIYRGALLMSATLLLLGMVVMASRYMESQRKVVEQAVFLKSVTDTVGVGVVAFDQNCEVIFANPRMDEMLDSKPGGLHGVSFQEAGFSVDENGNSLPATDCKMFNPDQGDDERIHGIRYLRSLHGKVVPAEINVSPLELSDGKGRVAVFQDITQRLKDERELRLAGAVFTSSQQGIIVTDSSGTIIQVNPAYCRMAGYTEQELLGQNPRILKSGLQDDQFYSHMWHTLVDHGSWNGELYNRRKNGEHYVQWANIDAVRTEQGELLYVGIASDITELVYARERLAKLAYYDTLTNLPNRVLFQDRISQTIAHARRDNLGFALILADLDDFKAVNDTMGHAAGDKLLMEVAERLKQTTRESDTVARLGGDEFALVLLDIDQPHKVAHIAANILESLSHPYRINGLEISSSVSLGITFWPLDGETIDELLKNADVAMYRAKEYGRNNYQFFTSDMAENVINALRIENGLRHALDAGELSLYYQPQIDPQGRTVCAEALLRWHSEELGWVPPSQFIPVAERSGLIVPLEDFALREACRQCAEWRKTLSSDFRIAVNISAAQFRYEGLLHNVAGVLHGLNLPGSALELEITESVVMEDVVRGQSVIHDLKKIGCSLAIDDFGTGYSSLSYLNQFKVDVLKIDKTFVDGLGVDSDDTSVAAAIVSLAKSLNLTVVAEGVETALQLEAIKKITDDTGCH